MLFDLSHSSLDDTKVFRHQESVNALYLYQLRQQIAQLAEEGNEEEQFPEVTRREPQEIVPLAQSMLGRVVELTGAIALLIITSPIMLFVAALLYFSGNGSVIYSQERVGLGGKRFNIYKFRTMRQDAEALGPRITLHHNDNRITPLGKFLRKSKLDELPQLWNVIKDEMAFIGPRPERPFFHDKNALTIDHWEQRLCVKPGISGLAQVTVDHDPREKIIHDLEYIRNRSWTLNLRIMFMTAVTLVRREPETLQAPVTFERA